MLFLAVPFWLQNKQQLQLYHNFFKTECSLWQNVHSNIHQTLQQLAISIKHMLL